MYTLDDAEDDMAEASGFTNSELGIGYLGVCDISKRHGFNIPNILLFTREKFINNECVRLRKEAFDDNSDIEAALGEEIYSQARFVLIAHAIILLDSPEELMRAVNYYLED